MQTMPKIRTVLVPRGAMLSNATITVRRMFLLQIAYTRKEENTEVASTTSHVDAGIHDPPAFTAGWMRLYMA